MNNDNLYRSISAREIDCVLAELPELTDKQKHELKAKFLAKRYLNAKILPTLKSKMYKLFKNSDFDDFGVEIDFHKLLCDLGHHLIGRDEDDWYVDRDMDENYICSYTYCKCCQKRIEKDES